MNRRATLRAIAGTVTTSLAGCALPGRSDGQVSHAGQWLQGLRDARNTARIDANVPVEDVSRGWRHVVSNEWIRTQPVVGVGHVFVGTAAGSVIGIDVASGDASWRATTAGVQATPALVDDLLVVPGDDGTLHGFDGRSGIETWSVRLDSPATNSVTTVDGRLYVVTARGTVYALDSAGGTVQWRTALEARVTAKPAVADGTLFITGDTGGRPLSGVVVAIDAASGDVAWMRRSRKPITESARVGSDGVYVAGPLDNAIDASSVNLTGDVFRFDPASGEVLATLSDVASYRVGRSCSVDSVVPTTEGVYLAICQEVVAYAADGTERWRGAVEAGATTDLNAAENGVLVGDSNGRLHVFDAASGQSQTLTTVSGIAVTPAVLDSAVVAATNRAVALVGEPTT